MAPYWHSYTYDKTGNRKTETLHDLTGDTAKDTRRTYTYPADGAPQPHTLTEVTQAGPSGTSKTSYTYDATGNTATRVIGGDTQKLEWDAEGHLAKVTRPVEGKPDEVTEYVYDTEGNRLIARGPDATTLYLGQGEVVLPKGAAKAKATRYIELGSGSQAVQSDDGTISITVADHLGTGQLAIKAKDLELSQRRNLPFGSTRGNDTGTWPGTKGFVGGTDETSDTGLVHLGAREYDPTIGRFISVDPVMDLNDPQQINGYAYAKNTPVTFADPSGLAIPECLNPQKYGITCKNGFPVSKKNGGSGGKSNSSKNGNNRGTITVKVTIKAPTQMGSGGVTCGMGRENLTNAFNCTMPEGGPQYKKQLEGFLDAGKVLVKTLVVPDTEAWRKCLTEFEGKSCAWAATDLPWLKAGKIVKISKISKVDAKDVKRAADCKCFRAGTGVLMADGSTKRIEEVELGDKVIATDPETGETRNREVTATIVTDDDRNFTDLTIATPDGEEHLTATHEHPFWAVSEGKWVEAGKLKSGMTLRTEEGRTVKIVGTRQYTDNVRTYNLTIEGLHTYYVLAGATPVLVHNSNCGVGDALKGWQTRYFQMGDQHLRLTKQGMQHILERHHPSYRKGPDKATQTNFRKNMSTQDVEDAISSVTQQNRGLISSRGVNDSYQVEGVYGGVTYTMGISNGRIGQFYPH